MIRLGLRLAVAGGREAVVRLVIIAAAVAIGVALLLTTVAGVNAVERQNQRYAWLNTGLVKNSTYHGSVARDPALWLLRADYFHMRQIGRVDVAATGPDAPVPPGVPRLPGPGEYYASPELGRLLRSTPADQLADRFPGRQIGTIGATALPAANSLLIIVGDTPQSLARLPYVHRVDHIETTDPSACEGCVAGTPADGIDLILSVVAAALLFPLLMFIGTATRLSAARREQRFAAMRLIGATPRQISMIATVESAVAALAGVLVGFGLFLALRPAVVRIPFTGEPFLPDDLGLTTVDVLAIGIGVPLGAAVAARIALRRVQISPLGVTRRVTPKPPRARRLILLVLGVAELAFFVGRRPESTDGQIAAYLSGVFAIMIGLVVAGPWLTMLGSRLLAGRVSGPSALIAARRLADNPQAGFRAVSGLMLALFVTAVATGIITSIVADSADPGGTPRVHDTLSEVFWPDERPHDAPVVNVAAVPAALRSIPGVRNILLTHVNPAFRLGVMNGEEPAVIGCDALATDPEFGRCLPGARVVGVSPDLFGRRFGGKVEAASVWGAASVSADRLAALPLMSIVVHTDGRAATIERARTLLETAFPGDDLPGTEAEFRAAQNHDLIQWQQLANVVILTSLPIAGCSLAVSVAGGLSERKRPFSMLRLTGVRLRVLRRVVALESAVPLLAVAVLAIGMGFLTAHLFLKAQLGYRLHAPGVGYWAIVLAGLVASLAIIASTLPLLRRITGPETARNE